MVRALPDDISLDINDVQLGVGGAVRLLHDDAHVSRAAVGLGRHEGPEIRDFIPNRDGMGVEASVAF